MLAPSLAHVFAIDHSSLPSFLEYCACFRYLFLFVVLSTWTSRSQLVCNNSYVSVGATFFRISNVDRSLLFEEKPLFWKGTLFSELFSHCVSYLSASNSSGIVEDIFLEKSKQMVPRWLPHVLWEGGGVGIRIETLARGLGFWAFRIILVAPEYYAVPTLLPEWGPQIWGGVRFRCFFALGNVSQRRAK